MSENLDLVRSIYVAWERGDFDSADWAHSEIEFVIPEGPDRGTFRGVGAMAQTWGGFLNAWDDYRVDIEPDLRNSDEGGFSSAGRAVVPLDFTVALFV